jgi:hypothetical protein
MRFDDRLQASRIVGQLSKRDRPSEGRTIAFPMVMR